MFEEHDYGADGKPNVPVFGPGSVPQLDQRVMPTSDPFRWAQALHEGHDGRSRFPGTNLVAETVEAATARKAMWSVARSPAPPAPRSPSHPT